MSEIEFGLDTFGGVTPGVDGAPLHHAQVIRDLVEDGVVADQLGLDFFAVGEHHRPDFAVSSPEMVLSAIAARTERIRLGSAVTVLSSDDPVRVFERFATLDAVSGGRAEVVAGRGSFIESFPLFGYDLRDYEVLFEERLELLAALLEEEPVTWSGSTRASLTDQRVYPETEGGIRAWVGVGGSPESVVRTACYGGGQPRSAPIRRRVANQPSRTSARASSSVSAISPGEWMAMGRCSIPNSSWDRSNRSMYGAKRAAGPPMIARNRPNP